jgi:hypothetical protein
VGSPGSGNGQFFLPFGVATDGADNIYVVDVGNHRIQKFGPGVIAVKSLTWGQLKVRYGR